MFAKLYNTFQNLKTWQQVTIIIIWISIIMWPFIEEPQESTVVKQDIDPESSSLNENIVPGTNKNTESVKTGVFNDVTVLRDILSQNWVWELWEWKKDPIWGYMSITPYHEFWEFWKNQIIQNNIAYYLLWKSEESVDTIEIVANIYWNETEWKWYFTEVINETLDDIGQWEMKDEDIQKINSFEEFKSNYWVLKVEFKTDRNNVHETLKYIISK